MRNGPHILVCSESGTGKSTFAASIIGTPPQLKTDLPVLVHLFDPADKGEPYRQRGDRCVLETYNHGELERVYLKGKLVAVIERWHEKQGKGATGITMSGGEQVKISGPKYILQGKVYENYLERMKNFADEVDEGAWYAYIHDSATFCELALRSYLTGVMQVRDMQMIYAQAALDLERFYLALFADLPITTMLLSHAVPERVMGFDNKGKRTRMRGEPDDVPYEVRTIGRLAKDLFASFGEVYRGYVTFEKNPELRSGRREMYWMQTRSDGIWRCASQLHVPNPLGPWYEGGPPCDGWKQVYAAKKG